MTQWLLDTFVYTGLLIGFVLLVRRPVARHFGPQVAYALWALPLLRFVMPPLVLPASMAPEQAVAGPANEALVIYLSEATANASESAVAAPPQVGIALIDLLIPLWLTGAAVFLAWRARNYIAMRRELLEDARPVGEAGKVRLVETPAVSAPVAFGIGDKVVALPPEFMAHHNIAARDMAIAHELAHHRGYDLVANIAAQPLLALHWFNPLAWWGWRAMRKDQEAACDARVVAGRARSERAAYAEVIAGFAAGEHLALAAPMACPVLGEKSIIHRLRSLTMTDVSSRRKKLGIAAIATTALVALPVTASITYAQEEAPPVPEAPAAPPAPAAPAAPLAPDAPLPPVPPTIESVDPGASYRVIHLERDGDGEVERRVVTRREVVDDAEFAEMMAEIESARAEMRAAEEEIERAHVEMRLANAEQRHAQSERRHAVVVANRAGAPAVQFDCDDADGNLVREFESDDGKVMIICQRVAYDHASSGIRQARAAIASDSSLSREQRETILEELDDALEQLQEMKHSMSMIAPKVPAVPEVPTIRFEARVKAPAVPRVPSVVRTSSVRFGNWQAMQPAPASDECEDEEDIRFTT